WLSSKPSIAKTIMALLAGWGLVSSYPEVAHELPVETEAPEEQAEMSEEALAERPALNPRHNQLQALLSEVPATQQLGLPLGEQEFYALYQPHQTAQPLGGVVLLHDVGQHGDWPRLIRPLRLGLAEHGWSTLSLNLQEAPGVELPSRVLPDKGELFYWQEETGQQPLSTTAESGGSAEAERPAAEGAAVIQLQEESSSAPVRTPMMIFEEQALRRLGAGIAYLRQVVGDELVVVGIGDSARSEEHTSELQSRENLVCRLLLEKKT